MSIKKYLGYNERKCRIIQNFLAGVVISHKIMNGLIKFAIVTSFKGPSLTYEYRYDFSMNQIFMVLASFIPPYLPLSVITHNTKILRKNRNLTAQNPVVNFPASFTLTKCSRHVSLIPG